jgi:S-adenosylmethionine:tRNA ribosyltransferase-isomerase
MNADLSFVLPEDRVAHEPPEQRGLSRDQVRLLVLDRQTGWRAHSRFDRIGEFLQPGDLLVFNASQTLPALLEGCDHRWGLCAEVRLAGKQQDGRWLALIVPRSGANQEPAAGMRLRFGEGLTATLLQPDEDVPRLWQLRFSHAGADLLDRLHRLGQPIRYEHVTAPWPLADYQTVYAREPGSSEMPSAGRAFTWELLFRLRRRGVHTTSLILHTGLSSYLDDAVDALHIMPEEEYLLSPETVTRVEQTQRHGGRVVAVGTTVVRALESAVDQSARLLPGHGYTRLRITAEHELRAVDGLLTGLHEPEASHLDLLSAFVSPELLQTAYAEAVDHGYLWHEFGDLNLILPQ